MEAMGSRTDTPSPFQNPVSATEICLLLAISSFFWGIFTWGVSTCSQLLAIWEIIRVSVGGGAQLMLRPSQGVHYQEIAR